MLHQLDTFEWTQCNPRQSCATRLLTGSPASLETVGVGLAVVGARQVGDTDRVQFIDLTAFGVAPGGDGFHVYGVG